MNREMKKVIDFDDR